MSKKWRLLDTGYAGGSWNIAVDEALMIHHGKGETPPTLRFYAWDPPAVSTGYSQDIYKKINVDLCREKGIDIVRRFTGGRAILHDNEITYSVTVRQQNTWIAGNVMQSYLKVSECLIYGLRGLNIDVSFKNENPENIQKQNNFACYDTPSRHEIIANGRKLIGSAQGRKHGCILQHGSIPFELDAGTFFSLINFDDERIRVCYKENFQKKAVSLNELGNRNYSYKEVMESLKKGFVLILGIELEKGELTPEEINTAKVLWKEKYMNKNWTFGINKQIKERLIK